MIYPYCYVTLDYPKQKNVHNLFTITTNIQGVLWKRSFELLNEILEKYLRKTSFFSKVAHSIKVVKEGHI